MNTHDTFAKARIPLTLRLIGAAFLMTSYASAGNLVLNPGFDTGNFTDWVKNTTAISDSWVVSGTSSHTPQSGSFSATEGCISAVCLQADFTAATPQGDWIYQNLNTVSGSTYTLTFFYDPGSTLPAFGADSSELRVMWGGALVDDLVFTNQADPGFIQFTVSNLSASSTSTQLAFLGQDNPSFAALDTIDVEGNAGGPTAPEPSSIVLCVGGLMALLGLRRLTNALRSEQ